MATELWWWPWGRPQKHAESADQVAVRLDEVANELEKATSELRSLVTGLRAVKADREGSGSSLGRIEGDT